MLQCQLRDKPCLEENCALWVEKKSGFCEKRTGGQDNSVTTYEHKGCCAILAIAYKVS